jgi:hypothetical protein
MSQVNAIQMSAVIVPKYFTANRTQPLLVETSSRIIRQAGCYRPRRCAGASSRFARVDSTSVMTRYITEIARYGSQ